VGACRLAAFDAKWWEAVIADNDRAWQSVMMQAAVIEIIELPEALGTVTLYDWMADEVRDGCNLSRTQADGKEVWRAEPPFYGQAGQQDCFTHVAWDGTNLSGQTWSGFRVIVDLDSGQVKTVTFTK
jgi:hypothetical protein